MEKAKQHNVEIILPTDYITASEFSKDAQVGYATDAEGIPDGWLGLDVGKESIAKFNEAIKKSKTILWNGPAGVFEFEKFAGGSISMLNACIDAAKHGTTVIVGGGDTATCKLLFDWTNFCSGCSEWKRGRTQSCLYWGWSVFRVLTLSLSRLTVRLLEGKALPGVTALSEK